jgi:hypothetical protein
MIDIERATEFPAICCHSKILQVDHRLAFEKSFVLRPAEHTFGIGSFGLNCEYEINASQLKSLHEKT